VNARVVRSSETPEHSYKERLIVPKEGNKSINSRTEVPQNLIQSFLLASERVNFDFKGMRGLHGLHFSKHVSMILE
jgi:hypothetical protein